MLTGERVWFKWYHSCVPLTGIPIASHIQISAFWFRDISSAILHGLIMCQQLNKLWLARETLKKIYLTVSVSPVLAGGIISRQGVQRFNNITIYIINCRFLTASRTLRYHSDMAKTRWLNHLGTWPSLCKKHGIRWVKVPLRTRIKTNISAVWVMYCYQRTIRHRISVFQLTTNHPKISSKLNHGCWLPFSN